MLVSRTLDSLSRITGAIDQTIDGMNRALFAHAVMMAAGIACSVWIADSLGLDGPYWAGITAMVIALPDRHSMLLKCLHRLVGTYLGAAIGLAFALATGQSLMLYFCSTFVVVFVGLWMTQASPWPYAWRIGAITATMVLAGGAIDPDNAHMIALFRPLEVTIGILTMAVFQFAAAYTFGSPPITAIATPTSSETLSDVDRFKNSCSPAIAACVTFLLCRLFHLPGGVQSVISVCALALTGPLDKVEYKAAQRLIGSGIGAIAGLAIALGLGFEHSSVGETIFYWITLLVVGTWLSMLNRGPADCAYFALQAEVTFLVVCAQSSKPSAEFAAGFARLEGVLIGVTVFYLIEWMLNVAAERVRRLHANTG